MHITKAVFIIRKIINGYDPHTKQQLAINSITQRTDIIGALKVADEALDYYHTYQNIQKGLPENTGKLWTKEDLDCIKRYRKKGYPYKKIARKLKRTEYSIELKLNEIRGTRNRA